MLGYPTLEAGKLAVRLGLMDEAAVRLSVRRSRRQLGIKLASAGLEAGDDEALIENIPWSGYRLKPERVMVRMHLPD